MTTPDISAAIANARDVYESVPNAGQVLDYLQAVLQADADTRAAAEWRERALKAEAALAARGTNEGFMTGTGHGPVPAGLVVGGSNWIFGQQAASAAFDQAAAKMAAESAQMSADAERMAARAATGTVVADLMLTIDTSAIDAALAKVEQLKAALAQLSGTVTL
jgi:hypothetical protein